jgi:DtxR family Mn-dependent transcriptional regulator
MKPTRNIEDYLKGIFILKGNDDYSHKKLAQYLNVSQASVSEMLKKMASDGYVEHNVKQVELTKKGQMIAMDLLTKHRIWELFLVKILNFTDKKEVHHIAEKLEHVTPKKLLDALIQFLGNPKKSPNDKDIYYDYHKITLKLQQTKLGERIKIIDIDSCIFDYMKTKNIKNNDICSVYEIDFYNQSITLKHGTHLINIAREACEFIEIIKVNV